MTDAYFRELCAHARAFAGLTAGRARLLHALGPRVVPQLDGVTDRFYAHLQSVARTAPFLEGRLPSLRRTHRAWLEELFGAEFDHLYVERMYRVGSAHVQARLPVEFIAGGMTAIANELGPVIIALDAGDLARQSEALRALHAALGFALIVMQESYQVAHAFAEREHFLAVSGLTRDEYAARMAALRPRPGR
jgi:hypothetical protein